MSMGMEVLAAGVQRRAASLWIYAETPFGAAKVLQRGNMRKTVTALALARKVWLRCLACFLSTLHELCNSQLQEA